MTDGGGLGAAIFDFGGVMARSPMGRLNAMAAAMGLAPDVFQASILGGGDGADNPWHDAECGWLSLDEEFGRRMAARVTAQGGTFSLDEFVEWVAGADSSPQRPMVRLVEDLQAAGIPTALLTNSVREFRPVIEATISVSTLFDVIVDSCEVGLRKPDARIYRLAAERLGLPPEACLFVDDFDGNVTGAADVGMTALLMADAATTADEIRRRFAL